MDRITPTKRLSHRHSKFPSPLRLGDTSFAQKGGHLQKAQCRIIRVEVSGGLERLPGCPMVSTVGQHGGSSLQGIAAQYLVAPLQDGVD